MKYIFLILIQGYQRMLSPFLGKNCRFYPTCSSYGYEAISAHGAFKGLWLTIKRWTKCHPFHPGGIDLLKDQEHSHG